MLGKNAVCDLMTISGNKFFEAFPIILFFTDFDWSVANS